MYIVKEALSVFLTLRKGKGNLHLTDHCTVKLLGEKWKDNPVYYTAKTLAHSLSY